MVLFLHNSYRTTGGEERAVEQLLWLVREQMGEAAELLCRDSRAVGRGRAALGLLCGGLEPGDVTRAVRLGGARAVHAHNIHPLLGWRALAAAREAGARVVLHLHQYRLVCAIGVCFTRGEDCTRCHGRDTLPGVRLNCRGSVPEALTYGAALSMWQRRIVEQADAVLVPSAFARERLRELGAPLRWETVHVLPPPLRAASDAAAPLPQAASSSSAAPGSPARGDYALVASRLSVEKGVDVAIDACRLARVPLVVAGDGPARAELQARARGADVRFAGRVEEQELARLRSGAAVAVVASRAPETFGLAAAEAMAAGIPVVATRVGALPELVEEACLAPPGDPAALAQRIATVAGDVAAGARARERVRARCAPELVARGLSAVYDGRRPPEPST